MEFIDKLIDYPINRTSLSSKVYLLKFQIKYGKELRCLNTKGKYSCTQTQHINVVMRYICVHLYVYVTICYVCVQLYAYVTHLLRIPMCDICALTKA